MAKKFGPTIKKLQNAINSTGRVHVTINKNQYYVEKDDKYAEVIIVNKVEIKPDGKKKYVELFSSGSDVAITLFLRDMWYELNEWEVPTDNELWEEEKRKYAARKNKKSEE